MMSFPTHAFLHRAMIHIRFLKIAVKMLKLFVKNFSFDKVYQKIYSPHVSLKKKFLFFPTSAVSSNASNFSVKEDYKSLLCCVHCELGTIILFL